MSGGQDSSQFKASSPAARSAPRDSGRDQRSPRKAFRRKAVALIRGKVYEAQTVEISETGMMLEAEAKTPALQPGDQLVITFHLSPTDFVSARLETVTVYPGEKGAGTRYGAKFVGHGMATKRAIRSYIAGNLNKAG